MPLFVCSKCLAIDNTAIGSYWSDVMRAKKEPICFECETGKWHGRFPKQMATLAYLDANVYHFQDAVRDRELLMSRKEKKNDPD